MKALSIFFSRHKFLNFIVCIVAFWGLALCIDLFRVDAYDMKPLCCMETGNDHYTGLGYSFDIVDNPGTGEQEYAVYIFGNLVKSTFTNEIEVSGQ